MNDLWDWCVRYEDGSVFVEFDVDGTDHGWAEIEADRVVGITLIPNVYGVSVHHVTVPRGATPYMRRRRYLPVEGEAHSVTIIGWHKDGTGAFVYCYEDGSTLLTDEDSLV